MVKIKLRGPGTPVSLLLLITVVREYCCQRWNRGPKARGQGQGHKKNPKPRTAFRRTDPLEAKDRNARGQKHRRKCSPKKKRSSKFFFRRSPIHWRTQNF